MSIEVGGFFGVNLIWRDKTEKWHDDCVGARKKQGATVMCWGMVGWGWKGPFYVWEPETKEEREEAEKKIKEINEENMAREAQLNAEWKSSSDWQDLRAAELAAAAKQRAAEKQGAPKARVPQTWRGKKFKISKIKRGDGKGIDSWRYVKHVARPILWPECRWQLLQNPNFVLMEDNAPAHDSDYTNKERQQEGITKVEWPPNSPDFNPIEHIWTLMKKRILRRRGLERITSVGLMKEVLVQEWDKITIEEINAEIAKLPGIMQRCLAANGGNKYHA